MDAVSHHGRRTAYRRMDRGGDGPTLLCVHGSGATHEVWSAQLGRLSGDRPTVALDLSGHGESEDIDAEPGWGTRSAYVDDVVAVARETDARVLLGNSLGGAILLQLALERDVRADALVLAGSGAKLAVLDDLLAWLDGDFDRAVEFLHGRDCLFHDADERYVELSKRTMYECGQAVTRRDFRSCHTFDVRHRLEEIDIPTLALTGEYDRLTPPHYHEYLAERVPNGEHAVVEDAAHLAMLERPDAFNANVADFLDRVSAQ